MPHRLQTFSIEVSVNVPNWTTLDCFACLWEIFANFIPDSVVTRGGRGEQTHHCDEKKIDGLLLTSELLFFVYR